MREPVDNSLRQHASRWPHCDRDQGKMLPGDRQRPEAVHNRTATFSLCSVSENDKNERTDSTESNRDAAMLMYRKGLVGSMFVCVLLVVGLY